MGMMGKYNSLQNAQLQIGNGIVKYPHLQKIDEPDV
jgi:hypothetical protein